MNDISLPDGEFLRQWLMTSGNPVADHYHTGLDRL
jgi:hypothetical protein